MRAVIVDDEPLVREAVEEILAREPDVEITGRYGDGVTFLADLATLTPDVIFLDIEMSGINGFEVVDRVRAAGSGAMTVFITAHDRYAARAFDEGAVDYVLKPFDQERVSKAVLRARSRRAREGEATAAKTERPDRVAVRRNDSIQFLRIADIDWIEADGNYVRFHVGRESFLYRASIVGFEAVLDASRFVRINRATIVNIDRVVELRASFGRNSVVLLRSGERLLLSPVYRSRLRALVPGL